MRILAALALTGALLAGAPAASAATEQTAATAPPAHHGRWLTDAEGRVLVVHGLNMVYKLAPYTPAAAGFGADDARFLAAHGFNAVRLGVIYAAVEPAPGLFDDHYLNSIATTVHTLAGHGVLSLLDFHQDQFNERFHGEGFPAWSVQDDGLPNQPDRGFPANLTEMPAVQHAYDHLFADSPGPGGVGLRERYAAAWGHVAARFVRDPAVLGYDLFNEPWPGTGWGPCLANHGCPAFDAQLGALESEATAAIRASDRRHLVFYEPNVLFNYTVPTYLPAFGDPRLGMSFHDYCPKPADCAPGEKQILDTARARTARTGDALLLSEWGSASSRDDTNRVAALADADGMSWLEWAYCGCGDPTGAIPPSTEALVLDPRKAPTGANVVAPRLRELDRPYPQAIAGTPVSWSFDPASRVFALRYRTRGVRRLAAHATTRVFLPLLQYPHGWRIALAGARVAAHRGQTLILAARAGARQVTLRVAPR